MERMAHPTTLQAYAALDEPEHEFVTELVRGRVVREPRPGGRHGAVQVNLAYHLKSWMISSGRGAVYVESGFVLEDDPATVRGPDIAVVLGEARSVYEPGGWIRGAPDLAVEVLSPSDSSRQVRLKVTEYLQAGAALVWIVDPQASTVTVYRADGSATVVRGDDSVSGEDVLPTFTLSLEQLFADVG